MTLLSESKFFVLDYYNSHSLNRVCFGENDLCVYAGNQDNSIYIFDLNTGKKKDALISTVKDGIMINVNYVPTNNSLYSGDTRGNFYYWK